MTEAERFEQQADRATRDKIRRLYRHTPDPLLMAWADGLEARATPKDPADSAQVAYTQNNLR